MILRRGLAICGLLVVLFVAWRVASDGRGLERRLLRAGGSVVQMAAQRPVRSLTWLGGALGVVWLGIGLRVLGERQSR